MITYSDVKIIEKDAKKVRTANTTLSCPFVKGLCTNYLEEGGGGGVGKWVKYAPKLSHTPLSWSENKFHLPLT